MTGTAPQKFGRLVAGLAFHPQYLTRYIRHNLRNGHSPLELEIPWFSYAAIDYLETFLQPNMEVFEFGSGGSTLFFAKRTKHVSAVENDPAWFDRVLQRLKDKSVGNVEVQLRPFDVKNPGNFAQSNYLKALPEASFDVIVVDGAEEWTQVRPICFQHAEQRVNPGGVIVVDDSWRYPGLRASAKAKRYQVFRSVGPCRPGVTSTDLYFY
ncbi:MAG TPA: class I SAM-dependent methyltransferase [Verrucomicrobiae bacterium]|jgi:SAM-dependent methyltransferase|nr:class I SAM-dependent methyltransferase [Verrucomicrobiae bacterium]